MSPAERAEAPRACVFAPSPLVTVTIEGRDDDGGRCDDVHIHAGGQGFWIARMMASLGADVVVCSSFGGESGLVARALIESAGLEVRAVETPSGCNGAYVHDRRSGERVAIAETRPASLTRHEVDELYGAVLVEALEADVTVLGGVTGDAVVDPDSYRRLTADLTGNDKLVVADLSGEHLDAVIEGGASLLKVSHEELLADGRVRTDDVPALLAAMRSIVEHGAGNVVVTRAEKSALALIDGCIYEVVVPPLKPVDHRGAGDSFTAGLATAMARGCDVAAALRLGAAAGGINVTRRGLASGARSEIERLAEHVEVRSVEPVTS